MPINTTYSPFLLGVASFTFLLGLSLVCWGVLRARNASEVPALRSYPALILRTWTGKEARKESRADVNWAVSMDTSEGVMVGTIKNVSLGGAFVCCKKPLPLGEVFPLTMIGLDGEPVAAKAEVIWSNAAVPNEKVINRGMGVRLIEVSDGHIHWINKILQEGNLDLLAK